MRGLGDTGVNAGMMVVRVLTAGPLSAPDAVTRVFTGGAFVVLAVAIFILRLGNEEFDSALVQPAAVGRVQAVAAGPRARAPCVAAPVNASATLLSAARHQPVGGARGILKEWLRPSQNPVLQSESVLERKEQQTSISRNNCPAH